MKILIIEDNHLHLRDLKEAILEEYPDLEIVTMRTESQFREEVDGLRRDPPAAIVMDLMLRWTYARKSPPPKSKHVGKPESAGLRCIKLLHEDKRTRKVRVILYTVAKKSELPQKVKKLPGDVYFIKKSSDHQEIVRRLGTLLALEGPTEEIARPALSSGGTKPSPTVGRSGAFISYSRRDSKWLERLKKMLKPLIREHDLEVWDDTQIKAGDKWKEELEKALRNAKVGILLVSDDFLASDFIADNELPNLLKAAEEEGLRILWFLVSSCLYDETAIAEFQGVCDPQVPLDTLTEAEWKQRLAEIGKEIGAAIK